MVFNDESVENMEALPRYLKGGCDLPYLLFYEM
jgi:hypothetical protein